MRISQEAHAEVALEVLYSHPLYLYLQVGVDPRDDRKDRNARRQCVIVWEEEKERNKRKALVDNNFAADSDSNTLSIYVVFARLIFCTTHGQGSESSPINDDICLSA